MRKRDVERVKIGEILNERRKRNRDIETSSCDMNRMKAVFN